VLKDAQACIAKAFAIARVFSIANQTQQSPNQRTVRNGEHTLSFVVIQHSLEQNPGAGFQLLKRFTTRDVIGVVVFGFPVIVRQALGFAERPFQQ
jgi:hypothetical protein